MKLLFENWREYLNEIGEGTLDPYPYDYDSKESSKGFVIYKFETDNKFKYEVIFSKNQSGGWNIYYAADVETIETGGGEPLKIMSTVLKIIKDFISKPELNKNVRTYTFEGVPKRGDELRKADRGEFVETVRTKLYMRYLKKHMPEGTRIYEDDNVVRFILPEDKEDKQ